MLTKLSFNISPKFGINHSSQTLNKKNQKLLKYTPMLKKKISSKKPNKKTITLTRPF